MKYPVILFVGSAGAGKDEAAKLLGSKLNGVRVSLADPIKRFALHFGFCEDQLWGPSRLRNEADPRFESLAIRREVELEIEYGHVKWLNSLPFRSYFDAKNELSECCRQLLATAESQQFLTPRHVLQVLGTGFGRKVQRDIWVQTALQTAELLLGGNCTYSKSTGLLTTDQNHDVVVIPDGRFRSEIMTIKKAGGLVIKIVNPEPTSKDIGGIQGHVSESEQDGIPEWHYDYVLVNDKSAGIQTLDNLVATVVNDIRSKSIVGNLWGNGDPRNLVRHGL